MARSRSTLWLSVRPLVDLCGEKVWARVSCVCVCGRAYVVAARGHKTTVQGDDAPRPLGVSAWAEEGGGRAQVDLQIALGAPRDAPGVGPVWVGGGSSGCVDGWVDGWKLR